MASHTASNDAFATSSIRSAAHSIPDNRLRPSGPSEEGLQTLRDIFRHSGHLSRPCNLIDVVLIAIDFEGIDTTKNELTLRSNCQAGLAILDTKEIGSVPLDKLVKNYNFATGTPTYLEKACAEFTFGNSKTAVTVPELSSSIQAHVPPFRHVIFVGHGMFNDLQVLRGLGIRFPTCLSAILDTLHIARDAFGYCVGSLGKLLMKVRCPHQGLHCAGNDAHFTLKILLLLAAKGLEGSHEDLDMINILQQIGKEEKPRSFDPEVIAQRDKKRRKSKKQRSVRSDLDLIDDCVALGRQIRKDIEHGTKKADELTEAFNRKHAWF